MDSELKDQIQKLIDGAIEDIKLEFQDEIRRLEVEIENLRGEIE